MMSISFGTKIASMCGGCREKREMSNADGLNCLHMRIQYHNMINLKIYVAIAGVFVTIALRYRAMSS